MRISDWSSDVCSSDLVFSVNPPIDSLRERRVMTLKTRLGNLGNILDEDEAQLRLLQLESPVLSNAEFEAMVSHMGETAATIDCTFAPDGGQTALAEALDRIRHDRKSTRLNSSH